MQERPEIVVPEEAASRGHLLRGELRSADICIPAILAQFSGLSPHTRDASIFFYPTLDEAKILLEARSPFSFEGQMALDGRQASHYRSSEIWLNYGSKITFFEMRCYTGCSGRLVDLEIRNDPPDPVVEPMKGSAWFVTNGCHLLRLLATPSEEDLRSMPNRIERSPHRFSLSHSGAAEICRITARHSRSGEKETRKRAYAIQVGDLKDISEVERDVGGMLVLASLASRERSDFGYWSIREPAGRNTQNWRFGFGKWPKRSREEEPLIWTEGCCSGFLASALQRYLASPDSTPLDAAVFALLARDLPIETRIVRLYTALQGVLIFGLSLPVSSNQKVGELHEMFQAAFPIDLRDLWPLTDRQGKPSLNRIRNVLVHGKAFTDRHDFQLLSIAGENLQWILERVLLTLLGWDVEHSAVSRQNLRKFTAHQWASEFKNLRV